MEDNEKRIFTTKQVFVSAKYFLTTMGMDENTVYPVTLSILSNNGGSTITLHSRDEVFETIPSSFILECGVVKAIKKPNGKTFVDIRRNGRMTIPVEVMPYIRNQTVLRVGQVSELYDEIMGNKR